MVVSDGCVYGDIQDMPITAPHIKITYRYEYLGQKCQNTQFWRPIGAAFLTATMLGVLEAHWADLQPTIEPIMSTSATVNRFVSLLGEEIGGGGTFAEYAVPTADQLGTRAGLTVPNAAPSYVNWGFRQTVGTRTTRPGQKRFPFVADSDMDGNAVVVGAFLLWEPLAIFFSQIDILGAPVATGELQPEIGGTEVGGVPTVWQDVTGYVLNPNLTSQVSRKEGHGT